MPLTTRRFDTASPPQDSKIRTRGLCVGTPAEPLEGGRCPSGLPTGRATKPRYASCIVPQISFVSLHSVGFISFDSCGKDFFLADREDIQMKRRERYSNSVDFFLVVFYLCLWYPKLCLTLNFLYHLSLFFHGFIREIKR